MFDPVIVFVISMIGLIGIMPYSERVLKFLRKDQQGKSSEKLALAVFLQGAILMTLSSYLGSTLASSNGYTWVAYTFTSLSESLLFAILVGALSGLLVGLSILLLDALFFGRVVEAFAAELRPRGAELLGASLYGGLSEEIMARLFALSAFVYMGRLIHMSRPLLDWLAVTLSALAFSIGHLPTAIGFAITRAGVISRTIALNTLAGIVFGYLFLYFGLLPAMLSHALADIVTYSIKITTGKESIG
jgi:hypothetical protein